MFEDHKEVPDVIVNNIIESKCEQPHKNKMFALVWSYFSKINKAVMTDLSLN